jgi:hypothetical protein
MNALWFFSLHFLSSASFNCFALCSNFMATYQAFTHFTAQGKSVRALLRMYALLEKDGVDIPLEPVIVFLAFSIESYLNSIGSRQIPFWDEIERLPWRSKINLLHIQAGKEMRWGEEPLQFASEVFRIRDKLAHGKPEQVFGPNFLDATEPELILVGGGLQPDWYLSLTREWVVAAKSRFNVLMPYLGGLFGLHESDHLHTSTGGICENYD